MMGIFLMRAIHMMKAIQMMKAIHKSRSRIVNRQWALTRLLAYSDSKASKLSIRKHFDSLESIT